MSEIKREITDRFLNAIDIGGAAYISMRKLLKDFENSKQPCKTNFPKEAETFDFSIIDGEQRRSSIIAEIDENLSQLTGDERERYLFSLLTPFRFMVEEYLPVINEYRYRAMNKSGLSCSCCGEYRCIDGCCYLWEYNTELFAIQLDALLLTYGIDLLQLQETCGIHLLGDRNFQGLILYIGSEALARHYIDALPQRENVQGGQALPVELDTEQARGYFARAVDAGLMTKQFEWLKSKALLACFCREMSNSLNLGKGSSSDGVKRISWKPFEEVFTINGKKSGSLGASLNDIKKTGANPVGIEQIDSIFKD